MIKTSSFRRDARDAGFGSKIGMQAGRFLNQNGTFNVKKTGLPFFVRISFYHELITMSWQRFALVILGGYFLMNFFFACIYFLLGNHISGMVYHSSLEHFIEAYFFSAQTFTTVGYGRVNPIGFMASLISSLEALIGIMSAALMTGILYGRFSKPQPRIIFSQNGTIASYDKGMALMVRLANAKSSQVIEAEAEMTCSIIVKDENGNKYRKYYNLDLERQRVTFLALSWTLVHPLNEKSPLFGLTSEDFNEGDIEVLVMIKGYDSTFSQQVYSMRGYKNCDFVWGHRFIPIFHPTNDGNSTEIELDKLNTFIRETI
ncbi:MAG: ion channel [Bacteroidota bacterium]